MIYTLLKFAHVLSIVVWVGGMVFAHFFLRPAAVEVLAPPQRVPLMHGALRRFLNALIPFVIIVLVTGLGMVHWALQESRKVGLAFPMPLDWTLMAVFGVIMMLIFAFVRFVLFRRLSVAVQSSDWPTGGQALQMIRFWVATNMVIGVGIIGMAMLMT